MGNGGVKLPRGLLLKNVAAADALGWQTERMRTREEVERAFGVRFVDRFFAWEKRVGGRRFGHHDRIAPGDYSDDTQLTLATARSIRPGGAFDAEYFARIELPALGTYIRGGGATTKAAIRGLLRPQARWYANFFAFRDFRGKVLDYRGSGANGVAMRISPIAFATLSTPERGQLAVFENAIATHGHPRAILGALAMYWATVRATALGPDPAGYLEAVEEDLRAWSFPKGSEISTWARLWEEGSGFGGLKDLFARTREEILHLLNLVRHHLADKGDQPFLRAVGAYSPESRGSATVSVAAAIYGFLKYWEEPDRAILRLVNHLGIDTDTIASMTAALFSAAGKPVLPALHPCVQDSRYLGQEGMGRLPPLPGAEGLMGEPPERWLWRFDPPIEKACEGDPIFHPLFGKGEVEAVWKGAGRQEGNPVARVRWEYGQSMVISRYTA